MQAISLSVDLFVRSVHYLSATEPTLDAQSLKVICDAVNTILDVPSGSTTVISYATLLSSDYDEVDSSSSGSSSGGGGGGIFRDVQVELRVFIRSLTANFRSVKLIDKDWLITYLGSVLIASAHDEEFTSTLRDAALASGAHTMLLANVTDAMVEYVPPSSPADDHNEQSNDSGASAITLTQVQFKK